MGGIVSRFRLLWSSALLVLAMTTTTACSDEDECEVGIISESELIGRWVIASGTYEYEEFNRIDVRPRGVLRIWYYDFEATYGADGDGAWELCGNTLVTTYKNEAQERTLISFDRDAYPSAELTFKNLTTGQEGAWKKWGNIAGY